LHKFKENWIWMSPRQKYTPDMWRKKFEQLQTIGIDNLLFFCSHDPKEPSRNQQPIPINRKLLDQVLPIAESTGIKIHAWIYTLLLPYQAVEKQFPTWYVVNRNGASCLEKTPYVIYYKWLCPSNLEVQAFVTNIVAELTKYSELTGIHLDYIRFPDVILPEALRPKYGLIQDRELPEFDYCYCDLCRQTFQKIHGKDPLNMSDAPENANWRFFRYQAISRVVNQAVGVARKNKKFISAAVFPTPELARTYVRQDWPTWDLDAIFPMIYHNFYKKNVEWIEFATRKGVTALPNNRPLFSGLFIPKLTPIQLRKAFDLAAAGGAKGVALFSNENMRTEHWNCLLE